MDNHISLYDLIGMKRKNSVLKSVMINKDKIIHIVSVPLILKPMMTRLPMRHVIHLDKIKFMKQLPML